MALKRGPYYDESFLGLYYLRLKFYPISRGIKSRAQLGEIIFKENAGAAFALFGPDLDQETTPSAISIQLPIAQPAFSRS